MSFSSLFTLLFFSTPFSSLLHLLRLLFLCFYGRKLEVWNEKKIGRLVTANCGPDWPEITTLLARQNGYLQASGSFSRIDNGGNSHNPRTDSLRWLLFLLSVGSIFPRSAGKVPLAEFPENRPDPPVAIHWQISFLRQAFSQAHRCHNSAP